MLKWIGNTKGIEGLPDIPARDLTDDEVERLGGEAVLLATGLYERITSKKREASLKAGSMTGVYVSPEKEAEIKNLQDKGDLTGAQKIVISELERWEAENDDPKR